MGKNLDLPKEAGSGPIFHPDWGTHAYASYNANVTGLNALLALAYGLPDAAAETLAVLEAQRKTIDDQFSGPWRIDVGYTMLSWQIAMRVAAVEVYLQDALTFLGVYDSEFIRSRSSVQSWDYEDVRRASEGDDAVWTFCNNWARSFVGDGGPARWAKSLRAAGLGNPSEESIATLESMWGYRHLRIHNAGRLSSEFVRRHPAVADRLYREGLTHSDFEQWRIAADAFVSDAERGIAGRLRAKLGAELIKEREQAEMERQFKRMHEQLWRSLLAQHPEAKERYEATEGDEEARYALIHELLGIGEFAEASKRDGGNAPPGQEQSDAATKASEAP